METENLSFFLLLVLFNAIPVVGQNILAAA
jgi:hypothetical protein